MAFPTPMVRPLDESQGFSPLQGHGSWLVCEVALRLLQIGVYKGAKLQGEGMGRQGKARVHGPPNKWEESLW